jgi:hypothetical protein
MCLVRDRKRAKGTEETEEKPRTTTQRPHFPLQLSLQTRERASEFLIIAIKQGPIPRRKPSAPCEFRAGWERTLVMYPSLRCFVALCCDEDRKEGKEGVL